MKTALYFFPALVIASGLLIRARILKNQNLIYISKPVSTLIVVGTLLVSFLEPSRNMMYSFCILAGLLFSLGGDIALMFEEKKKAFIAGIAMFLAAHVTYAAVFIYFGVLSPQDAVFAMLLCVSGVCVYKLIQDKLYALKIPVIIYIIIISIMVSRAYSAINSTVFGIGQALMIASGAMLFYISDVILALNQFYRPWKRNYVLLAFYYSGQFLIALSASYF